MLNRFGIASRLLIGFGIIILIAIVMAIAGITELAGINTHLYNITQINGPEKDMAQKMRIIFDGRNMAAQEVALALDQTGREAAVSRLGELRGQFKDEHDKFLALLKATDGEPQEFQQLEKIMAANEAAQVHGNKLVALAREGKNTEAKEAALALRIENMQKSEPK